VVQSLVAVLVLVTVLVAAAWWFQRRLIYFPPTEPVAPAGSVIIGARDVTLHTSDGLELGAWFVPPEGPARRMTVLVANGNAGDRAGRAPLATALAEQGFAVLVFDYRGYAGNPGGPSETGLALDARAAYDYLVSDAAVPPSRVLFLGESLGAAVVTELATEHPPAGLVLRSPFVDLASVGHVHYPFLPVRLLLRDDFPVSDQLADIEAPVCVVYGSEDSIVPPDQSRRVARSVPTLWQLVEVTGADHNDTQLAQGEALIRAVIELADHVAHPRP
jgi:alpha-beta hydrolase superfamily lysophospholipase